MRFIIFTWEFPPRIVGKLANEVNRLALELVKKNFDVHVVTYNDSWTGYHQGADGIKAYRIPSPFKPHINILTWALSLNQEVARTASDIYYLENRSVDLIDVHDWHFVPAAVSLKRGLMLPFVFSIDSLENHRSHGSNAPLSLSIKSMEALGTSEAERIVVKSEWMRMEVNQIYHVPLHKIEVVSPDSPGYSEEILAAYRMDLKVSQV